MRDRPEAGEHRHGADRAAQRVEAGAVGAQRAPTVAPEQRRRRERAEEAARKMWREQFDVATARAVADLSMLAEYCLPLVKQGGLFISLKGSNAEEEVNGAKGAVTKLGGQYIESRAFVLPDDSARSLIFYKKISQTPPVYPRNGGKIAKAPLK